MKITKCRVCGYELTREEQWHGDGYCNRCLSERMDDVIIAEERLESRRKYKPGEPITSFEQYDNCKLVYFGDKIYSKAWIDNFQYVRLKCLLRAKCLREAIRKKTA